MKKILDYINLENDFVILDVDRTIINTTSWYHACKCPDLLIHKDKVSQFIKMNSEAFANKTVNSLEKFRIKTLQIMETKISNDFINKIKPLNKFKNYFKEGEYTNNLRLYLAGIYTSQNLVDIYNEAIQFIFFISRYYGNKLKLIFLTSGYEPFIHGVIDGIMEQKLLTNISYNVVGSEIKFSNGIPSEEFYMSQIEKQKFIEQLIKLGCKIRFLADDSTDNLKLFETVKNSGGFALQIKHIPNQLESKSWIEFNSLFSKERIKDYLKKEFCCSIKKKFTINSELIQVLLNNTNEIGITSIPYLDYENGLNRLINHFLNNDNKNVYRDTINELIFVKDNKAFLRGKIYYNWLPPYVFMNYNTLNERWKELMNKSICLLKILVEEKIFSIDDILSNEEQVLIYSVIDHLLEGILYILNLIEQNQLNSNNKNLYSINENKRVYIVTQKISDLLYCYLLNLNSANLAQEILKELENIQIIDQLPQFTKYYKYMREMDNNLSIFLFVKSVCDEAKLNNIKFDYIINFTYGGIALGFALKSYLNITNPSSNLPEVLNCHYSSKQKIREEKVENEQDFYIFDYIPNFYKNNTMEIKKGKKKILLLDNNVTTFKTLDISKKFLMKYGNSVYATVVAVNYDNIYRYLTGNACAEKVIQNWRNVLDFYPIEEYITAFNTWNTSDKTKLLEKIYYSNNMPMQLYNHKIIDNQSNYIFKICRVHNLFDLNVSLQNGANMIGIHAVYPDRLKYLANEEKYKPIQCDLSIPEELPIALLEIESIREMEKCIPNNVQQAILFEKPTSVEIMHCCCNIYQISNRSFFIQLQHRTNQKYIKDIKNKICKNIIITVGLFQKDFYEYFWNMNKILNSETDYILLDLSKHQPDIISGAEKYNQNINKVIKLKRLAKLMENNKVPIILADDTTVQEMKNYIDILRMYNIKVKGIDMQNIVELKPSEQRYQMFNHNDNIYQGKIRKSSTLIAEWKNFFQNTSILGGKNE